MPIILSQKRKDQISEEIRGLRRRPENIQCVDCPLKNCSYACTNFNTFLCSDCAGLYRKHTFRVKSCTVATFTEEEAKRLREGGNKVCNEKYMAKWKKKNGPPLPTGDDLRALDDFIFRKYVKKEWYKEDAGKKEKKKKKKKKRKKEKEAEEASDKGSNAQLEADFHGASESQKKSDGKKDEGAWDPFGTGGAAAAAAPAPAPPPKPAQDDFLSGFTAPPAAAAPAPAAAQSEEWDPFGSGPAPAAAAAPAPAPAKATQPDLLGDLLGNMAMDAQAVPVAAPLEPEKKTMEEPKKKKFEDPFFTLLPQAEEPKPVQPPPQQKPVAPMNPMANFAAPAQNPAAFYPPQAANPYGQPQMAYNPYAVPAANPYAQQAPVNPYAAAPQQNMVAQNPYAPNPAMQRPAQPVMQQAAPVMQQPAMAAPNAAALDISFSVPQGVSADNPFG